MHRLPPRFCLPSDVQIDQPWRAGPLIRLLGGVLVCVFFGSVLALALRHPVGTLREPLLFGSLLSAGGCSLLGALWMVASPWPMERIRVRAVLFIGLVYFGIAMTGMARKVAGPPAPGTDALQLAITALSFQGAVLILVRRLLQEQGRDWIQAFGFTRQWLRAAVMGFMCAVSIFPLAWGLQVLSVKLLSALGYEASSQHAVNIFNLTDSTVDRVVLALVALVLAPIAEELLFRGVMYPALKAFGMPRFAFWATAVVFALIHFNLAIFLPLLALACLLNGLYEWTGNLLACIVAHAGFNAINLGMLMVMKTAFE